MTSRTMDKENASGGVNSLIGGKFAKGYPSTPGAKLAPSALLTPKVKCALATKEATNTGSKPKRAFGVDLLNTNRASSTAAAPSTTLGKTPKAVAREPCRATSTAVRLDEVVASADEPIEFFIGSKFDNFDDLYDCRNNDYMQAMEELARCRQSPVKSLLGAEDEEAAWSRRRPADQPDKKSLKRAKMALLDMPELAMPPILEDDF